MVKWFQCSIYLGTDLGWILYLTAEVGESDDLELLDLLFMPKDLFRLDTNVSVHFNVAKRISKSKTCFSAFRSHFFF